MSSDHGDPQYYQRYDWSDTHPSMAVLEGVQAVMGIETVVKPHTQGINLSRYIDLEAIDNAVVGSETCTVSFRIEEYAVHVEADSVVIERM